MRKGKRFLAMLVAAFLVYDAMPMQTLQAETIEQEAREKGIIEQKEEISYWSKEEREEVLADLEIKEQDIKEENMKEDVKVEEITTENTEGIEGKIIAQGTAGDNLTWVLDENGLLTISGTGEMKYMWIPWNSYRENIKDVVITEGVTSIGGRLLNGVII